MNTEKNDRFFKRFKEIDLYFTKNNCEHISKYWDWLNNRQINDLKKYGYDNFKRNIVKYYFTYIFLIPIDSELIFLVKNTSISDFLIFVIKAIFIGKHKYIGIIESFNLNLRTLLLWNYVKKHDHERILNRIIEPAEGNPAIIKDHGRLISTDIANAVLEYYAIMEDISKKIKIHTVLEIGGGYGRSAYVFLSLHRDIRYIMVDIPLALTVAETYLCNVFPERKIFKFRPFKKFSDISDEFNQSEIIFLTSDQIKFLPENIIDLFINVSSFHEMTQNKIDEYFEEIKRLAVKNSYLYFKEWVDSYVRFENVHILQQDYPTEGMVEIFNRKVPSRSAFFEALYRID